MTIKNVLLADDDADDAQIFQEALLEVDCGTSLHHAETGADVFKRLEEANMIPDVIFLDLNMPIMNGWQCLAKLKNTVAYQEIPVIMYTTSSNPRDYQIATDLGAHGLISKPSNPKILVKVLNTILCTSSDDLRKAVKDVYILTKV